MSIASLAAEAARAAAAPGNASTSSLSDDNAITNVKRFVPMEIVAVFFTVVTILDKTIDNDNEQFLYPLWLLVATILTPTFFALHFIAEYRRIHNGQLPSLRLFPIPYCERRRVPHMGNCIPSNRHRVVGRVVVLEPWHLQPGFQAEIKTHGGAIGAALLLVVSPLWMSINRAFNLVANPDTATSSPNAASAIADENTSTQSPNASSVQESANLQPAHLLAA